MSIRTYFNKIHLKTYTSCIIGIKLYAQVHTHITTAAYCTKSQLSFSVNNLEYWLSMYRTCTSYFIGWVKLLTVESRSEKGKLLFTAAVYTYNATHAGTFVFFDSINSFYRMHRKMLWCIYDYTHLNRYRPRLCKKLLGKVRIEEDVLL